jgi:hypothetical protein
MWCSTFTTITRHNRPKTSEFENEWRANKILGRSQTGWSGRFSNFSCTLGRGYEIREQPRVRRPIMIDFWMINVHTGWYVK